MILEPGPNARPHFFLIGFRAPPGGLGPTAQKVGVLVARNVVAFDGSPASGAKVLTADQPYAGAPVDGPFRFESEIATNKPVPDVVVVDDLALDLANFGTVEVDHGAGFEAPTGLVFGWRSRKTGPRVGLAGRKGAIGDPSSLMGFDATQFDLPDRFDNAFNNGHNSPALTSALFFEAGHRLRFTDTTPLGPDVVTALTIPPAPVLTVTENGQLLSPPLNLVPKVDTVVMDRAAAQFTVVWRADFLWEPRFEEATLTVN